MESVGEEYLAHKLVLYDNRDNNDNGKNGECHRVTYNRDNNITVVNSFLASSRKLHVNSPTR